jgi:hypothetical protein
VTVLFADVRRSTELASAVDPEDWHGILDGFFTHLADGVHRFEGTVNQYTGDGIMALFGAPIAHEDHAQRAGNPFFAEEFVRTRWGCISRTCCATSRGCSSETTTSTVRLAPSTAPSAKPGRSVR